MAITIALLLLGLLGLTPLIPAYGVALALELAAAAGMFLRVATPIMEGHLAIED